MANHNLTSAKKAKNDEFYTQYADIEKEVETYFEHNPDVFRGQTILSPCDDPQYSNFTKYFVNNFERLGLARYISTCYVKDGRGKIFTMDASNAELDVDNLPFELLDGDGDFMSEEITKIRDEADTIITNPPFSLFRPFLKWSLGEQI